MTTAAPSCLRVSRKTAASHRRLLRTAGAAAIGLAIVAISAQAQAQAPCPSPIPVPISPPNLNAPAATLVPDDVCLPSSISTENQAFAYFDDYSWRAFVALVWPALAGQRGQPDPNQPITAAGVPLVFETFKADWETFQPNGTPPSDFNSNASFWTSNPSQSPCPSAKPGDFILAPVSKFGNVGLAGVGNLVAVLIAQNGTFVRYLAAYNQAEFNQIKSQEYYLAAKLPKSLAFQVGALDVKSSWIDMTNVPHPERYHTRLAWLVDPISGQCSGTPVTVGLVGLHIVQKTPTRPQWIWSTFEQIDNVPPPSYVPPTPPNPPTQTFTFNDGTATPMPPNIPTNFVWKNALQAPSPPPPVNIQRVTPVNPSTVQTNGLWQSAFAAKNSVWQYYQLTMTQWPTPGNTPSNPGSPNFSVPGSGPHDHGSAFANTTLETWDQSNIRSGCMACHNSVQSDDFVWSLRMNAFKPVSPALAAGAPGSPAIDELRRLLEEQHK
jgi:hypothetical protein